jgi:hypothetical protein
MKSDLWYSSTRMTTSMTFRPGNHGPSLRSAATRWHAIRSVVLLIEGYSKMPTISGIRLEALPSLNRFGHGRVYC